MDIVVVDTIGSGTRGIAYSLEDPQKILKVTKE
jgi:hypothetical protein